MFKKLILSTVTSAVILTNTASAAELGSFLIKLQGGYSMSTSEMNSTTKTGNDFNAKISNKNLNGITGGIGFGYVASENIWTDVMISFDSLQTKVDAKNSAISKIENNNFSGMMNAYYGFNAGNNFSPYVMMGLGASIAKTKASLPTTGMSIKEKILNDDSNKPLNSQLKSKNTTYFAYQGGFGIAFEAMKSISFDLGYRLGNHQTAKFSGIKLAGDNELTLKPKTELKHSIVLGLNLAF